MSSTSETKIYRLGKARQVMHGAYSWYRKHAVDLGAEERSQLERELAALDAALLGRDRERASELAHRVEKFLEPRYQRAYWSYIFEIFCALAIALFVATIVRQMWFENQEIPSGSMRPTYREQDHLIVSKTAFGINMPFMTNHLYFDPDLLQRGTPFTFSADGIPMQDADTTYFGVFPYKKRLIKRLIGKPGDTLYFYGGRVYGVDSAGQPLKELLDAPWMQKLEYIPFMNFTGEVEQTRGNTFIISQMGEEVGKVIRGPEGHVKGQVFNGKRWVVDDPMAELQPHDHIATYSDIWGMRNFAMAQLLTAEQVMNNGDADLKGVGEAPLYLELRHSPNLSHPAPRFFSQAYGTFLSLTPFRTYLPLSPHYLAKLMDNLYTARFVVEGGRVYRYGGGAGDRIPVGGWQLKGVPDGTYEFYHGKGYSVGWGGTLYELPADSPLYNRSLANMQQLFNLGIDLHMAFMPKGEQQVFFPHRYAYFRNGDFYVMGAPLLEKGDPVLVDFAERELARQAKSTAQRPYVAFQDYGPPTLEDGTVDRAFLQAFGLHIPSGHYLALGDNHAMSGDSRIWGFVPEANIQGAPSFVFWPFGERWGWAKEQPSMPWVTLPHLLVWGAVAALLLGYLAWSAYARRRPIFKRVGEDRQSDPAQKSA